MGSESLGHTFSDSDDSDESKDSKVEPHLQFKKRKETNWAVDGTGGEVALTGHVIEFGIFIPKPGAKKCLWPSQKTAVDYLDSCAGEGGQKSLTTWKYHFSKNQ